MLDPQVEGVYETQVSLLFRAYLKLGCVCRVLRSAVGTDTFSLDELEMVNISKQPYLPANSMKHLYFYQHKAASGVRQMMALFLNPLKECVVVVVDTVRTNLMPNLGNLYEAERIVK